MPGMTRRRLRLWTEPGRLAGFAAESAPNAARTRLRELRDDVELTHVQLLSDDSIGVVLLVAPSAGIGDIDEIAAVLRETLGLGTGRNELVPDTAEPVRGIGGLGRTCPCCGAPDGSHLRGCPELGEAEVIGGGGETRPRCGAPAGAPGPGSPHTR